MTGTPAAREATQVTDLLFDLDGCLWFGDRLAPGAVEVVAELRARGYGTFFLTNASNRTSAQLAQKLRRLGIEAAQEDVLAPLTVLTQHELLGPDSKVLVLGNPVIAEVLREAGITTVRQGEQASVVVVGNSRDLRFGDLIPAITALDNGARLLALNLDRRVPTATAVAPGTGAIVSALTTATGVSPQVLGKPSRLYFSGALERFNLNAASTAMIGDSPDTDIAGGNGSGLTTILVGGATPAGPDEEPDFRIRALTDLLDHFPRLAKGVRAV